MVVSEETTVTIEIREAEYEDMTATQLKKILDEAFESCDRLVIKVKS